VAARLAALVGPIVYRLSIDDLAGEYLASYRLVTLEVDLDLEERAAYEGWIAAFRAVHGRFIRLHPAASWDDFVRELPRSPGRSAIESWRRSAGR
jgi:superfamily II DNA or RNA helicase